MASDQRRGFNDGLAMANSYYAATARPAPSFPKLDGSIEADLVVVGGGATGLSAALHAAERGLSVVLLEGGRIGWGASGRNGGHLIPGMRLSAPTLVKTFGVERARELFELALEARSLMVDLIARHGIDCDLKLTGHLSAAVKPADMRDLAEEVECLNTVMGYPHAELLSAEEARREVDSPYEGGLLDRLGGHFHPLNYTLGLATAAQDAGVQIFEGSTAIALEKGARVLVRTAGGQVLARHAVLAGDALMGRLEPKIAGHIMPVANYVVATEPLANARELIPHDVAVADTRFVLNYYRMTADGRLLFGGGERYTPNPPRDMASFVRPYVEGVFPQLRGVRIDHAWGGLVSITMTRMPHVGRDGSIHFAHGYSGQGAILSTYTGKVLVQAILGDDRAFQALADLRPPAFPGGAALRAPLHVLGMLWYAFRDRI
ncbi:NAD(P)/FAD-dependent oxidoreductase [Phenylobacterium sp.]|jgi:gamma-glutamylputrescine oxidase|uniref:NAD(P)/FAD-dependent oxidoreductase n=1 Tax=Phenylobacterium sp. TaxID=1871053 RepID=UPI0037832EA4